MEHTYTRLVEEGSHETLVQKAARLSACLGVADGMPIPALVELAGARLCIESELAGLPRLVQKLDTCLERLALVSKMEPLGEAEQAERQPEAQRLPELARFEHQAPNGVWEPYSEGVSRQIEEVLSNSIQVGIL